MPYFIAALFSMLSTAVLPLVTKVLTGLGLGAVSYIGVNFVIDSARAELMSNMAGIPVDIAQILGLYKFDVAINIILAAVTTRLVLSGVSKVSGSRKSIGSVGGQ